MNNGELKPRIAICRLAYGATHSAHVADWHARTCHFVASSPQFFSGLEDFWVDRMPVTVARNYAVEIARLRGCDFLVMIDADMQPDYVPGAPPFFEQSVSFALGRSDPCMIGAPCVRADGEVCVYHEVEDDDETRLMFIPADRAASSTGHEVVPATSLALCLIDMRCFDAIEKPYFQFGYSDDSQSEIACGEESFGARLTEAGVSVFVNWDCWAKHWKPTGHGKPESSVDVPSGRSLWFPDSVED